MGMNFGKKKKRKSLEKISAFSRRKFLIAIFTPKSSELHRTNIKCLLFEVLREKLQQLNPLLMRNYALNI